MASLKLKLAVLISGRGSNLQALIDACTRDDFPAEIAVVISNQPDAYGLARAQEAGIETLAIAHKEYESKPAFENALNEAILPYQVSLICLAGFMRILSAEFISKWPEKIINIHPSLLPAYKGLDTHARAIADGASEAGCTVHYVVPEVDSGEIIVQKSVPVHHDDTPETLAARVLEQEHIAYPEAIKKIWQKTYGEGN